MFHYMSKMGRITFDVGGVIFALDQSFLQAGPESKLKRMYVDADLTERVTPFIINRPPELFGAIVSFYVTGDLHIPMTSCPGSFEKELEFWEIDEIYLTNCCSFRLEEFKDRQRRLTLFQRQMDRTDSEGFKLVPCGSLAKARAAVWSFMENKQSGTFRELYFVVLFAMILVSILTVSFGTMETLQRNLTNCERLDFMKATKINQANLFAQYINQTNCDDTTLPDLSPGYINYQDKFYGDEKDYITVELPRVSDNQLEEVKIPNMTVPIRVLAGVDLFTLAFFTVDLTLRLISCPNLLEYFKSLINGIDAAALLCSFVYLVLVQVYIAVTSDVIWSNILTLMLVLRTLRLLRIIRSIREGRVLVFTLSQIVKELFVVLLFLISAVCIFASLEYASELKELDQFENIPVWMYWAMITLTTVGYGDIRPITVTGKVIACICALLGVLLFALTIPVFTNQFIFFNRYASLKIRSSKTDSEPGIAARNDVTESLISPGSVGNEAGLPGRSYQSQQEH